MLFPRVTNMHLASLLGAWIVALACGGCAFLTGDSAKDAGREIGATDSGQPILPAELDELTRAFADRYVGLLYSTCDALKKDNPDPVQRREAQNLLVDCATNVYDIASNADAFTRMLDLIVVTTLVSQIWIDDDRSAEVFPGRDDVLVRALHHGREEAWVLGAKVLRPEQLATMDYMLWDWRKHNPDMVRGSFVRFSDFAIGRGKSANAELVAALGLLGNVEAFATGGFLSAFLGGDPAKLGQAGESVDEVRLLTERMFYMFKRTPTLLRWQADAVQEGMLATPEVDRALADLNRLTDQIEQLPKNVAVEREAIVAALDDREDMLGGALADVRGALTDANVAVTSLDQASKSLNEMLESASALVARFDRPAGKSTDRSTRPFDIREYTETLEQLVVAAGRLNSLIESSDELLGSPEWDRRVQQVNESADQRMRVAAEQIERVVHDAFWRASVLIGILFAIFILCLAAVFLIIRRLRFVSKLGGGSRRENGHETIPTDGSAAGGKAGAE